MISDLHHYDNKRLLLTLSTAPELYILALNATKDATAYTLLYCFESEKACHAIAKLDTHTSAVLTSRSIWRPEAQDCILNPGTSATWKVDVSRWGTTTGDVVVEKLADFPNTGHLDKMATLPVPGADGTARTSWPQSLITDSMTSAITRFDPNTNNTFTWLSHPTMAPAPPDDTIWRVIRKSAKSGRTPLIHSLYIVLMVRDYLVTR
jgi:hypothetical protein